MAHREVHEASQANAMMKDEGYKYVDVRKPDEFAGGHVPGSINIPLEQENFKEKLEQAFPDKSSKLLVACGFGGRASKAGAQLPDYTNCAVFKGSFSAWEKAGMPVEK